MRVGPDAVADLGLEKPFWSHARTLIPIHQVSGTSDVVVLRSTLDELALLIAIAVAEQAHS